MRTLRMAASLRPVFLSSGSFVFQSQKVKWKKKNGAKIWVTDSTGGCCEPEFYVASTSPANRESSLSQTRARRGTRFSYCTDTKRLAGSCNLLMVQWLMKGGVSIFCPPAVYLKDHYNIFHKLIKSMQSLMQKGPGSFQGVCFACYSFIDKGMMLGYKVGRGSLDKNFAGTRVPAGTHFCIKMWVYVS